ncbi:protein LYK5 [Apium graveolens]|uniref:protein LYK5 n=1 Tax=Apium graveolens TaxID=4045 RepID=UPI003D7ABB08
MAGNNLNSGHWLLLYLSISCISLILHTSQAQQSYVNNKQLQCLQNYTTTLGYNCSTTPSCLSYVTFRSTPTYNTPVSIANLLNTNSSEVARLNNFSEDSLIKPDTLMIVPITCSCSGAKAPGGPFYQHQTNYSLKFTGETYFSVANDTYQGLTTCQSLISQNTYNYRNLVAGMKLNVPVRCACPSKKQVDDGYKYLLAYLITWGNTVNQIARSLSVSGANNMSVLEANELDEKSIIFPFTPLLVPLKKEPNRLELSVSPPPPPASPTLPINPPTGDDDDDSSKKWVYIGVGIGAGLLLLGSLSGFFVWFFRRQSRKEASQATLVVPNQYSDYQKPVEAGGNPSSSWSISSEGVRYAIGSLAHYKFEELQQATGYFGEANRIKGSVYRGFFNGDSAAVKIMRGDVSTEISILKQINHSNIIRLSGYCVHQGNTYLVYEYAEKGSVSDMLHEPSLVKMDDTVSAGANVLGWIQRVQIAYHIGDALNYLHNCINPPYIHKNLTTSNVLLDSNLRAKVANFRFARSLMDSEKGGGMQLTRHVVGTYGCMAPEYIENGLITPKLDVFAFGVVMLELLSGKEAVQHKSTETGKEDELLTATIVEVLGGENVREKLGEFMDPCLKKQYPLDLAYSMAQLARSCVADDINSRPSSAEVFMTLSKIHSSSLDWDPSDELEYSRSMSHGR